ncbi:MAG: hypothetical protein LQ339_004788 [Xanthoria mediterranea]|nr:MAG: hypothetical protein LQ339_004788 [Xanthoria mediterranea]
MRIRPEQDLDATDNIAHAPPGLKLDQVEARYGQVQRELEDGDDSFKYQIQKQFGNQLNASKVPKNIRKCVCTSLGSFTTNKYKDECGQANRPMFQDPEMNNVDEQWLVALKGYTVIKEPQATQEIDINVSFYTPCAYFSHVRSLFSITAPRLYVGVNLKKWITAMQPKPEYDNRGTLNDELRNRAAEFQNIHNTYVVPYVNCTNSYDILIRKDTFEYPRVRAYYWKR